MSGTNAPTRRPVPRRLPRRGARPLAGQETETSRVSEKPFPRADVTPTRQGADYEPAVTPAPAARDLARGPGSEPDPDLVAWTMPGARRSPRPGHEAA